MSRTNLLGNTPPSFPVPPDKYQQGWMSVLLAQLTKRFARMSSPYVSQAQILLIGENGNRYRVTIDDTNPAAPVFKFTAEDKTIGPTPL